MAAPRRHDDGWGAYEDPRQQATATTSRQVESVFAATTAATAATTTCTLMQSQFWGTTGNHNNRPTAPSSLVSVSQRPPHPPKKAKHHRRRHVPVGPAGVWFQAQHQHLQQGTKNKNTGSNSSSSSSSNARAMATTDSDDEQAAAAAAQVEEESGIEFTQGLSDTTTTTTTKVASTGVAFYSAAWIAMQCSLQFVTPSLPAYLSEAERYGACRPHVPGRFVMIPEILAGHCDWKLQDDNNNNHHHNQTNPHSGQQRRLLVLVHAIQSLADNLWVAELTDETGAKIQAWIQPRLVQQEQQRPKKKYIRPGLVWMLRNVTILLVTRSDSSGSSSSTSHDTTTTTTTTTDEDEDNGTISFATSLDTNHDRMLLVGEENIEHVWMPPQADDNNNNNTSSSSSGTSSSGGITDAEYIAWMERRNALTASVEDTELQENGLLTTTTTTTTMNHHTDTIPANRNDGLVDLEHMESIMEDQDTQNETGTAILRGIGSNQNKEESPTDSIEIRPKSFRNDPPACFGRPNKTTRSPLERTRMSASKGIASRDQQNNNNHNNNKSNRNAIAANPSQSPQRSRFDEFSANTTNNNFSNNDDQLSHSALPRTRGEASHAQDNVDDESKRSLVPPKNDNETHWDGQIPAAATKNRSLSQTKSSFGLERFAASQKSASTPPPPPHLSASPKRNQMMSSRGAAAKATQSDSTPISTSQKADNNNTPLSTSPVNRSRKKNRKLSSSSSKKKRKAKSTTSRSKDKNPKENKSNNNLWVASGAINVLDLFDEDDEDEAMVNVVLPQNIAQAEAATTVVEDSLLQNQKCSSAGGENTCPLTGSGINKLDVTKPASSLFQTSAFAAMDMGDFSEDEED